jgi:hypothetical protein
MYEFIYFGRPVFRRKFLWCPMAILLAPRRTRPNMYAFIWLDSQKMLRSSQSCCSVCPDYMNSYIVWCTWLFATITLDLCEFMYLMNSYIMNRFLFRLSMLCPPPIVVHRSNSQLLWIHVLYEFIHIGQFNSMGGCSLSSSGCTVLVLGGSDGGSMS